MRVGLFIPIYNPGEFAPRLTAAIARQSLRPDSFVVVDSGPDGPHRELFAAAGADVRSIPSTDFDHGGTRNIAFSAMDVDLCIFLTQDAVPDDEDAFARIVQPLQADSTVAAVAGRQVPRPDTGAYGRHARSFNYPPVDAVRTLSDAQSLGIRAAFFSNSFAAYRFAAMRDIGCFPNGIVWGEDTYSIARLLQQGWKVRYAADAVVEHAHDYSISQEFARYFDAGVFHASEPWYVDLLGRAEGEGLRFVRSEAEFLRSERIGFVLPRVVFRNGVRWLGYRTGRAHSLLPTALCRRLSQNRAYWATRDR